MSARFRYELAILQPSPNCRSRVRLPSKRPRARAYAPCLRATSPRSFSEAAVLRRSGWVRDSARLSSEFNEDTEGREGLGQIILSVQRAEQHQGLIEKCARPAKVALPS